MPRRLRPGSPRRTTRTAVLVTVLALLASFAGIVELPAVAAAAEALQVTVVRDFDTASSGVVAGGLALRDGTVSTLVTDEHGVQSVESFPLGDPASGDQVTVPAPTGWSFDDLAAADDGSFYLMGNDGVGDPPGFGVLRLPTDGGLEPSPPVLLPYPSRSPVLSSGGDRLYFLGDDEPGQQKDGVVGRIDTADLAGQNDPDVVAGGVQTYSDCHAEGAATLACMSTPLDMAMSGGEIWVTDAMADTVTVFDRATGELLHRYVSGDGVTVADNDNRQIGDELGYLPFGSTIAADARGNVFLALADFNGTGSTYALARVDDTGLMHVPDLSRPLGFVRSMVVDPATGDLLVLNFDGEILRVAADWADPPGAPTGLHLDWGHQALRATFDPPADDGGAAVTLYQAVAVARSGEHEGVPNSVTGSGSPLVVPFLDPGVVYDVSVYAENAAGRGPAVTGDELVKQALVELTASPDHGQAPLTVTLDGTTPSNTPVDATFAYHCGGTAVPQSSGDGRTATCHYTHGSDGAGFPASVTMHDTISGLDFSDSLSIPVEAPFVAAAHLTASADSGTAPLTVHLDAGSSSAPPGATFEFHCGDSYDPVAPASTATTADCTYHRRSPDAGWNAYVRMHDPATGSNYVSPPVAIQVDSAPGTVDDSAAFDATSPTVDITVQGDGSLDSATCGTGAYGATCTVVDGVPVRLAAGPGTFQPGTHVQVFVGDTDELETEIGSSMTTTGGLAVTWTPRQDLTKPLVVTFPKPSSPSPRMSASASGLHTGQSLVDWILGVVQGIVDGTKKVVGTVGDAINSAASAVTSLWSAPAHQIRRPNDSDTNDLLTCAKVTRENGKLRCQGPYTWQKDVPTSVVAALDAGSHVISYGGGNVIASGGGNVIAAGGGNVIAAGGGNLTIPGAGVIAAGGGNVIAAGGGNVIAAGGGNVIAAGGGNVIAAGGGNVIAAGGGNITMTLVRDPGFAFVAPPDTTPPTVTATLSPPLPESGVYPEGTTVTVQLDASSPADPAIPVQSVGFSASGAGETPYTLVPGDTASVTFDQPGHSVVTYGATDTSLNTAEARTVEFRIAGGEPAAQHLTISAPSRVRYGDPSAAVSVSSDAGLSAALSASPTRVCSVAGGRLLVHHAGTCTIKAHQAGTDDVAAADATRTVVVTPRALTIQATSAVRPRKGKLPKVGPLFSGFAAGDSIMDLDRAPRCKADKKHRRTFCTGAADSDYTVRYLPGRLRQASGNYAVLSIPVVYALRGTSLRFPVKTAGKHVQVKVKGTLPSGVRWAHNRKWSKVRLTGAPSRAGTWTVKIKVKSGHRTVAKQKLLIVVMG